MNYKINYKSQNWGFPECAKFVTDMSYVGTLEIFPILLLLREILAVGGRRLWSRCPGTACLLQLAQAAQSSVKRRNIRAALLGC